MATMQSLPCSLLGSAASARATPQHRRRIAVVGHIFNLVLAAALIPVHGQVLPVSGTVTTLAGSSGATGSSNGVGVSATFNAPAAVAMDVNASTVLVCDTGNHIIRRIICSTGEVSTLAGITGMPGSSDGPPTLAQFYGPSGVAISTSGAVAFVGDSTNNLIRSIVVSTGVVSTLAGSIVSSGSMDGRGSAASFYNPCGVAVNRATTLLVVADQGNSNIRLVNITTAVVSTLAGKGSPGTEDGVGSSAAFFLPYGVAMDARGAIVIVADTRSSRIRIINVSTRNVTLLAGSTSSIYGTDGIGTQVTFYFPQGVAVNAAGTLAMVVSTCSCSTRRRGMG